MGDGFGEEGVGAVVGFEVGDLVVWSFADEVVFSIVGTGLADGGAADVDVEVDLGGV